MDTAETIEEKIDALHDYICSPRCDDLPDDLLTDVEVRIIEHCTVHVARRPLSHKETAIVERCYEKLWKAQQKTSFGTGST